MSRSPGSLAHRLARVAILLILGLASTIAAAWACAFIPAQTGGAFSSAFQHWHPAGATGDGWRGLDSWRQFGAARYACTILGPGESNSVTPGSIIGGNIGFIAPEWSRDALMGWTDQLRGWPQDSLPVQGVDARGFPFAALWCSYAWNQVTEPDMWYWQTGGIQLGDGLMPSEEADWYPRASLPCLPIWPGLIADVTFYSAAWWGLFATPPAVIRCARRRRGSCTGCNYDLRGMPPGSPCPECGSIVPAGLGRLLRHFPCVGKL
jgi:hypothetical protein